MQWCNGAIIKKPAFLFSKYSSAKQTKLKHLCSQFNLISAKRSKIVHHNKASHPISNDQK